MEDCCIFSLTLELEAWHDSWVVLSVNVADCNTLPIFISNRKKRDIQRRHLTIHSFFEKKLSTLYDTANKTDYFRAKKRDP